MKLFKKHYEKFIFIFLLLLFVILFGIQTYSVISSQDETPDEKLKINLGQPIRKNERPDFEKDEYRAVAMFRKVSDRIDAYTKKEENLNIDILVPPQLAKCPEGIHLIPITDFPASEKDKNKKCSYCNTPLKDVPLERQIAAGGSGGRDSDNDGIPDADELKNGMDPKNSNDAEMDKDKDGFTNLEEYREKTEINNPKSRPRYARKLFVKEVIEKKIGIRITQASNDLKNQKDPEKWMIHFIYNEVDKRGKKRVRSSRLRMGRELKRAGDKGEDFLLKKIIPKFGDMNGQVINQSTVILERLSDNLEISARIGEDVSDPFKEVTFSVELPFLKEQEIRTVIGQEFKIGTEETEIDTFITKQATINMNAENPEDRQIVQIQLKSSGEPFTIKMKKDGAFMGPGMYGPEGMGMGYPVNPNNQRFRTPQF